MLRSTGVRPLEAVEEEDGCRENLGGCLVHNLRPNPLLKVDKGAEAQDAHLPVVEAARGNEGNFNQGQGIYNREGWGRGGLSHFTDRVKARGQFLPQEAVHVFEPLAYEMVGDGLGVVGKTQVLQRVEEE